MTRDSNLTAKRLRELLSYDETTGVFTRKVRTRNQLKVGDVAGCVYHRTNRASTKLDGRSYENNRLAWLYTYGEWPRSPHLDHIDNDPSNNRISNLREASVSQNGANSRISKNNKAGFKGVYQRGKKYRAQIMVLRKKINLGTFNTAEEAASAYADAAIMYFGEFARAA